MALICLSPTGHTQIGQAQDGQALELTGSFDVTVRVDDITNPETLGAFSGIYKSGDAISWHIYVPDTYDPSHPPGIFVFISPSKSGAAASGWRDSLTQENFIYISANNAGNGVPANRRVLNAVLAVQYISARYKTNSERTVIAGFSGGARVSSIVVEAIPDIFEASVFMGGAFKWRGDQAALEAQLGGGAYVFMTGGHDHAQDETRRTYLQYKKAGLKHLKLMNPRKTGHEYPKSRDFAQALSFISKHLETPNRPDEEIAVD